MPPETVSWIAATPTVLVLTAAAMWGAPAACAQTSRTIACNGSVLDGTINAVLSGFGSGGGTLFLQGAAAPGGTCFLAGSISIPSNVTLIGSGAQRTLSGAGMVSAGTPQLSSGNSTVLYAMRAPMMDDPDFPAVTIEPNATNVTIENLTVFGNGSKTTCALDDQGIDVSPGASQVLIQDVEVSNAGSQGIRIRGATHVTVLNSFLHESRYSGLYVLGDLKGTANETLEPSIQSDSITLLANYVRGYTNPAAMSCPPDDEPPAPVDGVDVDRITSNVTAQYNTVRFGDIILFDDAEFFRGSVTAPMYGSYGHVVQYNTINASTSNGIDISGLIINPVIQHNTIDITNDATNPAKYGVVINGPLNDPFAGNMPVLQTATISANIVTTVNTGYDVIYVENGIGSVERKKQGTNSTSCIIDKRPPNLIALNDNTLTSATLSAGYLIELSGGLKNSSIDGNLCLVQGGTCAEGAGIKITTIGTNDLINGMPP